MLQEQMGEAAKLYFFWICHNKFCALCHGFLHLEAYDWMSGGGICTDCQNTGGTHNLVYGVGHCTAAEALNQADDSGGMAQPCTMVYIVCAHNQAGELLDEIVFLVCALG
jgi:hypothetical protein